MPMSGFFFFSYWKAPLPIKFSQLTKTPPVLAGSPLQNENSRSKAGKLKTLTCGPPFGPATTFIYLDEIGDFAHTSDDLAKVQESLDDESELDQFLAAVKDTKNLVVFSITVNNGPFSNAVHVGIDMNHCEEEEQF